jgi:hypothetical protein
VSNDNQSDSDIRSEVNLPILQNIHYALMVLAAGVTYIYSSDTIIFGTLVFAIMMCFMSLIVTIDDEATGREAVANLYLRVGKLFIIITYIAACVVVIKMRIYVMSVL